MCAARAGTANNPAITRLLLERGAVPDNDTLYLSALFPDHECLQLLLSHDGMLDKNFALTAPISTGNVEGVRLLLEAGAAAIECHCSAQLIELLLQYGGDTDAPGRDGRAPLSLATRQGRTEIAALLRRYCVGEQATEIDGFLAACIQVDRARVRQLLRDYPDLLDQLIDEDHGVIVYAAEDGNVEATRLMLELGLPVETRVGEDGCTPLHAAALSGSADLARLLIDVGADLRARDTTWNDSPLVWATVGSGLRRTDPNNRHNPNADFVATVRTLIEAGAPIEDARRVPGKPPSAEVWGLLVSYGIAPAEDGNAADGNS